MTAAMSRQTGAEALRAAIPRLADAGVPNAARDARLLLAFAMDIAADRLTLHLHDDLSGPAITRFQTAIVARAARQPVAQIVGHRLFWGHDFRVTPDVLDPRPETELLVETALLRPFVRLLDFGTGSGAILLSCLAARPLATGLGSDISEPALAVARDNAKALHLSDRASFVCTNWCDGIGGHFDLIVSNPPYIAVAEMAALSPEVRIHEPHLALTPGGDGLDAYRRIAIGAPARLLPNGRLLVEIGPSQSAAVSELFAAQGLVDIQTLTDLDGRSRAVLAIKPK